MDQHPEEPQPNHRVTHPIDTSEYEPPRRSYISLLGFSNLLGSCTAVLILIIIGLATVGVFWFLTKCLKKLRQWVKGRRRGHSNFSRRPVPNVDTTWIALDSLPPAYVR